MTATAERAKYGAAAFEGISGKLPAQFPRTIAPSAARYVQEVLESGLRADTVGRFEKRFAEMMGMKHCVATPGCTPALHLLAMALELAPGDEVIVSPISDYGTLMGLLKEHLIPVFADTEAGAINLSAETIAPLITERTRAIYVVHMTGLVCDMDAIMALAARHNLVVVEDACQAMLSRYKGRLAGTLGHASAFSFDSEKTLGSDQAGCILTNDGALAERARFLGYARGASQEAGFGRRHTHFGAAMRMGQVNAALTLAQLEIIEEQVAQRDRMARLLTTLLGEIPGVRPLPIPDYVDVYSPWMVGFSIDPEAFDCSADEFAAQCAARGITGAGTARYYLLPAACSFLEEWARGGVYPYSQPPASHRYSFGPETCPRARTFLETFIRWSTFCEKYQPEHCELAARIVRGVADEHRR